MTTATTPTRPVALPVLLDSVPPALRAVPRWVLWKFMLQTRADGRQVWAKVPYQVDGKRKASSTDPATWAPFDRAARIYTLNPTKVDGIGFIFDGSDDWVGVDLDDCVVPDPLGGDEPVINQLAMDALNKLPGYWEVSPSGTGIKGWMRARGVGSGANHDLGIEVYPAGRYFAVTGHALPCNTPTDWSALFSGELERWVKQHVGDVNPVVARAVLGPTTGDDALDAFMELEATPQPFPDWTIERVRDEIAPHLDVEDHYEKWVQVGMILHHQFEGSAEALELWQDIYRGGSKFAEETGEEKWASFGKRQLKGSVATLGTLIKQTRDARAAAAPPTTAPTPTAAKADKRALVQARLNDYLARIPLMQDTHNLRALATERVAKDKGLEDTDRAQLVLALQKQLKTLGAPMPIGAVRSLVAPPAGGNMPGELRGWVFLINEDRFYNLGAYQEPVSRMAFDAMFNRCVPAGAPHDSAALMFTNVWQGDCLNRRLYAPPHTSPMFELEGLQYANTYNPASAPAAEDVAAVDAVLDAHFAMLLPDARERRLLLSWVAHTVSRPGVLLGWAPYVCGEPGTGKSVIGQVLRSAMGPGNVGTVPVKGLGDKFSGWATGRAVNILDEVKLHGENRHDVANAMKPYITEPTVSVEYKGRDSFDAPNFTSYLLFSNYVDGLPVEDGDRRYGFFISPMTREQMIAAQAAGHYDRLWAALRTAPGAVRGWVLRQPIDPEVLQSRAPETAGRARVLEAVEPEALTAVRQVLMEGAHGITSRTAVASVVARLAREKMGYRPQSTMLSSALEKCGWKRYSRAMKWEGRAEGIWVSGWSPKSNGEVVDDLKGSNDPTEFDVLT